MYEQTLTVVDTYYLIDREARIGGGFLISKSFIFSYFGKYS